MKSLKEVLTADYNRMSFRLAQLALTTNRNLEKNHFPVHQVCSDWKKEKKIPSLASLFPVKHSINQLMMSDRSEEGKIEWRCTGQKLL